MRMLIAALILTLSVSTAFAEVSFLNDNQGNSGTIITPGSGGISFYNDSAGNSGTIITPGKGGISFYDFSSPSGETRSGTVITPGRRSFESERLTPGLPGSGESDGFNSRSSPSSRGDSRRGR